MQILKKLGGIKYEFKCTKCGKEFTGFCIGMVSCPYCINIRFSKDIFDQTGGRNAAIFKNTPANVGNGDVARRSG